MSEVVFVNDVTTSYQQTSSGGQEDITREEYLSLVHRLQDARKEKERKRQEERQTSSSNLDKISLPDFLLLLLKLSSLYFLSSCSLTAPSSPLEALELVLRKLLLPRCLGVSGVIFAPLEEGKKTSRRMGKHAAPARPGSPSSFASRPRPLSAPPPRPRSAPPKPDEVFCRSSFNRSNKCRRRIDSGGGSDQRRADRVMEQEQGSFLWQLPG